MATEAADGTREKRKPLFLRLPDDWDDLTDEQKNAWSRYLLDRLLGSEPEAPPP